MYSNWLDSSLKNVCSAHIVGSLWCLPSRTKRETAKQTGHLPILMATPTLLQSDQLVADGGWRPLLSSQMLRCSQLIWAMLVAQVLKFWSTQILKAVDPRVKIYISASRVVFSKTPGCVVLFNPNVVLFAGIFSLAHLGLLQLFLSLPQSSLVYLPSYVLPRKHTLYKKHCQPHNTPSSLSHLPAAYIFSLSAAWWKAVVETLPMDAL